jgi:hypothetical protein
MSGAAVIVLARKAERRIAETLRQHGATRADAAIDLSPPRLRDRNALKRLLRTGSVHQTGDRYWLDERAWEDRREGRRVRAVIALILVALIAAAALVGFVRG